MKKTPFQLLVANIIKQLYHPLGVKVFLSLNKPSGNATMKVNNRTTFSDNISLVVQLYGVVCHDPWSVGVTG